MFLKYFVENLILKIYCFLNKLLNILYMILFKISFKISYNKYYMKYKKYKFTLFSYYYSYLLILTLSSKLTKFYNSPNSLFYTLLDFFIFPS